MAAREPSADALALLDAAACGLMQTSDDGTFRRVNHRFCDWIGVTPESLIGRRRFQDLLTMGGRIFHQTHWSPLLRMQGSVSEVKLEIQHADGSSIPMVLNAIRHEQDGEVVHEIAAYVARDRDRYERELVLSTKRLEELVAEANQLHAEAKDRALFAEQMIGIVSHDLRNPLSAIMMGAALLAGGELAASQQRTVGRITRAAESANRLISDLLDFTLARVGHGLPMSLAPIDLHEAVAESLDELRLTHSARNIVHVRSGCGTCLADSSRLGQLIGNLVSNAVTYGDPASPITVTSTLDATAATVCVHNAGRPIPAEALPTLFQAMTRASPVRSKARSVGLGLFIVREIARAHGGDVAVTSTLEQGTTFSARFPRLPAATCSAASPA